MFRLENDMSVCDFSWPKIPQVDLGGVCLSLRFGLTIFTSDATGIPNFVHIPFY